MRNELEYLAEIENYLINPNSDKMAFEKRVQQDANLQQDTQLIKELINAIQAQGIRYEIKQAKTNYGLVNTLKWLSVALAISLALLAVAIIYNNRPIENETRSFEIRTTLPATNEFGGTEWSQADSVLPYLIYTISGDKDVVIETPEGIIFSIPKGSFVDKNGQPVTGEFELEIKEAMNAAGIMKAGLSTWSDDKLLETGGMFYINAREDGENLQIAKDANVTSSVPKMQDRNDMMLFDGVRNVSSNATIEAETDHGGRYISGEINWVNPRKPISDLVSVSMDVLNFYPPNFEKTLAENGYPNKSKLFKDSVYLSFKNEGYTAKEEAVVWIDQDGNVEIDTGKHYMPSRFGNTRGEKLFKTHCERCHYSSGKELIGPGLTWARQRWNNEDKLIAFVQNSAQVLASGDVYANNLFVKYNKTAMPSFMQLNKSDITAILDYLDANVNTQQGIDPKTVLAFWNKEFNRTILATREFEKRMQFIHKTCDEQVLKCYTDNLDKPLYYCDSLAANITYGEQQEQFQKFYSQGFGKPADAKKITQALLNVFAIKQRELDAAYNRTTGAWFKKQAEADAQAAQKETKQWERNVNRDGHNFTEEFNTNLCSAYNQLGKECPKPVFSNNVRDNFNTFQIQTTGWKNVDVPVAIATATRTSMEYTDPETGKTATLTYTALSISVSNISEFDITETYLIPSGKMSFMRMKKQGGKFTESLNSIYQYHLVSVGYKGKEVSLFTQENIAAGDKNITLQSSTIGEVNRFVSRNASQRASDDMVAELKYIDFKIDEGKHQKEKLKVEKLREVLLPVVFPCAWALPQTTLADTVLTK